MDWSAFRTLTRYYLSSGATGVAVGAHTTQFELHDDEALLRDAWHSVAEIVQQSGDESGGQKSILVAGISGSTTEAVREAELARDLGYDCALVMVRGAGDLDENALIERARKIGEILPTIQFMLQSSIGGRVFSDSYWRTLFELESTLAVKVAPFDRYVTQRIVAQLLSSSRWDEIALLTGNDDAIVQDLISPYRKMVDQSERIVRAHGGLLGQWATGTRAAARIAAQAWTEPNDPALLLTGTAMVDINAAVFDPHNRFRGSIAGVHEMLRQQGLIATNRCLSPTEVLSPGQRSEITRVLHEYPDLLDCTYISENMASWKD